MPFLSLQHASIGGVSGPVQKMALTWRELPVDKGGDTWRELHVDKGGETRRELHVDKGDPEAVTPIASKSLWSMWPGLTFRYRGRTYPEVHPSCGQDFHADTG